KEASSRIPKRVSVEADKREEITKVANEHTEMVAVEPMQVTGRRCKASDTIISFERDACVWAIVAEHGVVWPDEVYQSLEQAHRLVFGFGFLPWEFDVGARSWVFPGLLAAPMALAKSI